METKTKTEAKHTPTPWEHGSLWYPQDGGRGTCDISQVGSLGIHLQVILPGEGREAYDEGRANVPFVIRAANAHDDLLSALRLLLQEVKADVQAIACVDLRIIKKADAAITAAEEG